MARTYKNEKTDLALMARDILEIKAEVVDIKTKLEAKYVTQLEFEPIRKIVYGLVSLILIAVVGALIGLVVIK